MLKLEKMEYSTEELIGDEIDLLQEIEESTASYICDAISEHSDGYIPIYNNNIWEHASDISEHIEEAIENGLTGNSSDLMKIFQSGYYQYYTQQCYENLEKIAYNVLVNHVNELEILNEELEGEIEGIIDYLSNCFDHNDSWDDLRSEFDDKYNDLLEELENEYEDEEE